MLGSLAVLVFLCMGRLTVIQIYIINAVIGVTNAFQQPASAVAAGRFVPKEKNSNVSGMNAFSNNLIEVFAPMLADWQGCWEQLWETAQEAVWRLCFCAPGYVDLR